MGRIIQGSKGNLTRRGKKSDGGRRCESTNDRPEFSLTQYAIPLHSSSSSRPPMPTFRVKTEYKRSRRPHDIATPRGTWNSLYSRCSIALIRRKHGTNGRHCRHFYTAVAWRCVRPDDHHNAANESSFRYGDTRGNSNGRKVFSSPFRGRRFALDIGGIDES